MFWFDKQNDQVLFMDNRKHYEKLESGHIVAVNPNIVADFRKMPFDDNSFYHVVFDPPHLLRAGSNSWLAKNIWKLNEQTWKEDIQKGFLSV